MKGLLIVAVLCALCNVAISDDDFDGQMTLQLQHSLGSDPTLEFIPRGQITLRSLKTGSLQLPQEIKLSEEERSKLMDLVDKDGFYRVRIPLKSGDNVHYVSTFLKACSLYESGLKEVLTLYTDSSGDIIGVSASTPAPQCQGIHVPSSQLQYFDTVVEVRAIESGPVPDISAFIQKMEKEKLDKQKNEQSDNRSFIAKYWMYILPVVILIYISGAGNQEAQGGGGR